MRNTQLSEANIDQATIDYLSRYVFWVSKWDPSQLRPQTRQIQEGETQPIVEIPLGPVAPQLPA